MDEFVSELTKLLMQTDDGQNPKEVLDISGLLKKVDNGPWGKILRQAEVESKKGVVPQSTPAVFVPKQASVAGSSSYSCKVDVRVMESYVGVYFEIPGVNKSDINLSIQDNQLVLNVDVQPYGVSSDIFLIRERYVGNISRSVQLPQNVDKASISARYIDGVLAVRFNKLENTVKNFNKILIQ